MAPPMKGGLAVKYIQWLILSKQKHINDYVKVFIHYYKHSCMHNIPFLRVYMKVI